MVDGKGAIVNTADRMGSINSKPMTMDFSKRVFLEMKVDEVSTRWKVNLLVLEEDGKQSQISVCSNNDLEGVRRFNLSYAMMSRRRDWRGKHRFTIRISVEGKTGDKIVLDGVNVVQTDEESLDIYESPFHYRPPIEKGNFGDPNPFFWNGEYHVFHMLGAVSHSPWDHIVSKDLVHWKELPVAIEAGKQGERDENSCGSGSVMERNGTFYLFYTGFNRGHPKGRQQVMMATSPDLVTWTKRPEWTFAGDGEYYYNVVRREVPMPAGRPITFQAFVQRSIIECFVNDGHAFTLRAYDYPKGKVSLTVDNGRAQVEELILKVTK
jgi:hypothetical protein